jgi:hypothetical protein
MVWLDMIKTSIQAEDNLDRDDLSNHEEIQPGGEIVRYDITEEIFQRLFVDKWRRSIRQALGTMGGVSSIVNLRGAAIDEQGPVDPDQILGAFTELGEWVPPAPTMLALKAAPTTVLDVTLVTGERLRVVLTSLDDTVSSPSHFVVLKAAS